MIKKINISLEHMLNALSGGHVQHLLVVKVETAAKVFQYEQILVDDDLVSRFDVIMTIARETLRKEMLFQPQRK